jgi:nitrate/nitrite-specific signal transduction histidine kinase
MADDGPKPNYVDRVRENTRRYIEDLLRENDRLRDELERNQREHQRLLAMLGDAERETRTFEDRYAEVEHQNANLASLYAASYQLHATVERDQVLAAIQEIVINLIGSEELAIVAVEPGGALRPMAAFGLSSAKLETLRGDEGVIGAALVAGRPVCGQSNDEMTACIPLMVGGRPFAAVAIYRLLPQKPALQALDLELFDLLATHAANALYCAELHERRGAA